MYYFCTYFDNNYLSRGLALHGSLCRHAQPFHLWIMCMDSEVYQALEQRCLPYVSLLKLSELEEWDKRLPALKKSRSIIEYYFTFSPFLPLFVFEKNPHVDLITYLDADLFFFSEVGPVFKEMGTNSILMIGHRFPEKLKSHEKYGLYNVGFLSFRRDEQGTACLNWWRERCIEWCFDRVEGDKFADQKYLEKWPQLFKCVRVLQHKGAGLAPWNHENYKLRSVRGRVYVDEDPLIFFHFHGVKRISRWLYDSNMAGYGSRLNPTLRSKVYGPYVDILRNFEPGYQIVPRRGRNPLKANAEHDFGSFAIITNPLRPYWRRLYGLCKGQYIFSKPKYLRLSIDIESHSI